VTNAFASVFSHFAIFYVEETRSIFLVGSPSPLRFNLEKTKELISHARIAAHDKLKDPFFLPIRGQAWRNADQPLDRLDPVNSDDSAYAEVWTPLAAKALYTRTMPEKISASLWPTSDMLPEQTEFFEA